jgi:hypothetical protein
VSAPTSTSTNGAGPNMLAHALRYAGAGIKVFPVNGKTPLTKRGFHEATTDSEQVELWWAKWPEAGIATPDFDAVDVDTYKPECEETWQRIKPLIPDGTPQTRTGGGGLQFLFAPGTLSDGKIGPGVDSRYAGRNYIVLPWSLHESGKRYEAVVDVLKRKPKPAPDFPREGGNNTEFKHLLNQMDAGAKITDGRNKAAWWRAVEILRTLPPGTDLTPVRALVQSWVDANCAGDLNEVDVPKQVRGAAKTVAAERATQHSSAASSAPRDYGELGLRPGDEFNVRKVEWLDKPFLQRACFVVFAGRKGSCKGTHLCGLAARVTNGQLYDEPKQVLVVTSEDSVELDFLPRLIAAGGRPELTQIVHGPFRMPRDLPWLEQQAKQLGNVGLIIIDPIGNHLGGADTDKEGQVRDAIAPLNDMSDELDCLIVGVRHLNKDASRGALSSVLGSTAWVDVPRSVIVMAIDDEDDKVFHAQVVAGNRGPRSAGRRYRLELVDVPPAVEITLLVPEGESMKDVEDLLGARSGSTSKSKSAAAREMILDLLEEGQVLESDALDAKVVQETGLASQTVRNQRAKLKNDGLVKAVPLERNEDGTVHNGESNENAPRSSDPETGSAGTSNRLSDPDVEDLALSAKKPTRDLESVNTVPSYPVTLFADRVTGSVSSERTGVESNGAGCDHRRQWQARDGSSHCFDCDPPAFPGEVVSGGNHDGSTA